ncbi:MAG: glycoside hydrolase family 18 [Prevotella sp.]|jgi:hypothetical protein|nr:glycoside hydrolase family 18 [Prevotella sp.]
MKIKIDLRIIVLSVFFISIAGVFSSCDDWTLPESLEIEKPSVETGNDALYQQYLKNLRDYKASYHQLLIGWFDNSNKTYVSRGMHLSSLPDKVDIVSLMEPDNLTNAELDEIASLKNDKGTRVIYTIDYDAIARSIDTEITAAEDALNEGESVVVPDFFDRLEQELDIRFALFAKYGYDGLCLGYMGFSLQFPTVADTERLTRVQDMLFQRLNNVNAKLLLFAGLPENIIDRSRLEQFNYIVLQTQSALDMSQIDVIAAASLQTGVPADRIIVSAYPPSLDPTDTKTGVFADGSNSIVGTAKWLKTPGAFTKEGLAVYRINDDYYNSASDYKYTREAIEIMNPSPKK